MAFDESSLIFRCVDCKEPKAPKDFYTRESRLGIRGQCKECYKGRRARKRYPRSCSLCLKHRRLNLNKVCGPCNRARGLVQCKRCAKIKVSYLDFYDTRAVCKTCLNKPPTISPNFGDMEALLHTCVNCGFPKESKDFYVRSTKHGLTRQCRLCYSLKKLAKKYDDVCVGCSKPCIMDRNSKCSRCNKEEGLKQCSVCGMLKLLFMDFYKGFGMCKVCSKG